MTAATSFAAATSSAAAPRLSDYHDMSTIAGRYAYNWSIFNPLNLRFRQADVERANATLGAADSTKDQLRHAMVVREACAPSGELIPAPFRLCGWALGGTPIITFMVYSAVRWPTSLTPIFVGQVLNQTQLAGCTYCNRGGPDGVSQLALARAYVAAMVTAVPIAFGAAVASKRWSVLKPFARFAPYPGVAAANAVACVTIRQDDVLQGVPVSAGQQPLGHSQNAGWAAVRDTALTRLCMPVGNFLLVPMVQWALERARGGMRPSLGMQVGVTAAIFTFWLPFSASLFPPVSHLPIDTLEVELRQKVPSNLGAISYVTYQRGV
jgi:hypothetical protein